MEPKDIEIKLNIKNYKVGKYIHLMTADAVGVFEKSHISIGKLLLSSLSCGDPKHSFLKVEEYIQSIKELNRSMEQIRDLIYDHMYSEFEDTPEGRGHQYITPEGGIGISIIEGKEAVTIGGAAKELEKEE